MNARNKTLEHIFRQFCSFRHIQAVTVPGLPKHQAGPWSARELQLQLVEPGMGSWWLTPPQRLLGCTIPNVPECGSPMIWGSFLGMQLLLGSEEGVGGLKAPSG